MFNAFIPPILTNSELRSRLFPYALEESRRLMQRKSAEQYFYDLLAEQIKRSPQIAELYPEDVIRGHYVYEQMREQVENPDLMITQTRFYRMYTFFKTFYPEIFSGAKTIVDVGDTSGVFLRSLGSTGTSVNINQECVDEIRSHGMEAVLASGQELPFPTASFDHAFCFQTLEHVPDPLGLLNELSRVARDKIFLSIPRVQSTKIYDLSHWIKEKTVSWKEVDVRKVDCHIFEFSPDDLRKLLSYTDLKCEQVFPLDYFDMNMPRHPALNKRFPSYFNFFVLAHK